MSEREEKESVLSSLLILTAPLVGARALRERVRERERERARAGEGERERERECAHQSLGVDSSLRRSTRVSSGHLRAERSAAAHTTGVN